MQFTADWDPGWTKQSGPAGPGWVCRTHKYTHAPNPFCIATFLLKQGSWSFNLYQLNFSFFLSCLLFRQKKTADFLRDAVETRLRMNIPYIDTWPQVKSSCSQVLGEIAGRGPEGKKLIWSSSLCLKAMSILLLPYNIPDSLKHLSTMVDDIWYYAGDRSTDVSGSYHHPRSPPTSAHTFLSPFHQHPHKIRPATLQVTPTFLFSPPLSSFFFCYIFINC